MFKQWAISSIKSMESLGYETQLLDRVEVDSDESGSDGEDGGGSDDEEVNGTESD